jgi:hypothetical protein
MGTERSGGEKSGLWQGSRPAFLDLAPIRPLLISLIQVQGPSLKPRRIGGNILPPYEEHLQEVAMTVEMAERYATLSSTLKAQLKEALRKGDKSLLGVVLNTLLAWPDGCFREEVVKHPRTRALLAFVPSVLEEMEPSPKEAELIRLCREEKARGRRRSPACPLWPRRSP